ncbi:MAG: DUF177 domain-containing protein [Clostridia bacterium]|jgi:uncharacterized protein|nr:DUF177 domain-containing protein [Clostridia bacterium]
MSLTIDLSKLRNRVGTKETINLVTKEIPFLEDITLFKPLSLELQVLNLGFIYDLKGTLSTELKTTCSRCLKDMTFELTATFEEKLINATDLFKVEEIDQKQIEEEYRVFNKDDKVDITEIVVEHFFNALPFKFLCSAHCQGICSKCGKNLNYEKCNCIIAEIDPRLAILANLKQD